MHEEYIIERQGRKFVLYAGLLEEAHEQGLRSVDTELLQVPTQENGGVAIVKAVVRTEEGKFSGIGDASPENVGRAITPHLIRMAETRAKARALRDAINVGVTALEELGEDEQQAPSQEEPQQVASGEEDRAGLPATRKQLNYLEALISDVIGDGGTDKFEEMAGKKVSDLTREEASRWIGRLSGRAA